MKNIMLSVLAAIELTTGSKAQFKSVVKVSGEPDDRPKIKPVENEEVFDHLFLHKYRSITILRETAA